MHSRAAPAEDIEAARLAITVSTSVAEEHHFYAAPATGKILMQIRGLRIRLLTVYTGKIFKIN
jgi:hypothetical protein